MEQVKLPTVQELMEDHRIFILPKNGEASKKFASLLQQSELAGIECSCGYLPELSGENEEFIYLPKDSSTGYANFTDNPNLKEDFISLQNESKEYTQLDHFKKELQMRSEVELFMIIEGLGGAIFTNRRNYGKGHMEMEEADYNAMQKDLLHKQLACLPFLRKFGLEVILEENGGIKRENRSDYDKWYKHWKEWMENFSNNEWREVEKLLCSKDSALEEHLPKKRWNEE